jgi:chromosome segregation protein
VSQHDLAAEQLAELRQQKKHIDQQLGEAEVGMGELSEQIEQLDTRQQSHNRETTHTKVELAKSEERLRNLHARMRQFDESRRERSRAIDDGGEQLDQCLRRAKEAQRNILHNESRVAELYIRKEAYADGTVELINSRELLRRKRTELTAESQRLRNKTRKAGETIHAEDLAANEIRHERSSLADRLRDDYNIELAELEHVPSDEEQRLREEVQGEIDDLRRKINNLGNVNVEALEELNQLEGRHGMLNDQYSDLVEAKASLERIIDKINIDSRRLFAETLETVTGHFRKMYRDLFGGGHGDIVLDEGVDILESGIELVARPPGKEPRNISLLSGGEKTLTCVALLLAIFRSRPSPFCVLDEVDAALDEANIDRFTQVIQDFLDWTQFIIVTHSKKTMTAANTIYGVTMQESGVSKQVSVRFDDVSEDGHIRPERIAEAEQEAKDKEDSDDSQAA